MLGTRPGSDPKPPDGFRLYVNVPDLRRQPGKSPLHFGGEPFTFFRLQRHALINPFSQETMR